METWDSAEKGEVGAEAGEKGVEEGTELEGVGARTEEKRGGAWGELVVGPCCIGWEEREGRKEERSESKIGEEREIDKRGRSEVGVRERRRVRERERGSREMGEGRKKRVEW